MATTSDQTFEITGLSPFTSYSFTVQACSDAGCGPETTPVSQLTEEEGMYICVYVVWVGGCGYMLCRVHVQDAFCWRGGTNLWL